MLREVAEETGLSGATVVRRITVEDEPHPDTAQPRRTTFFLLRAPDGAPDAWEHRVRGDDAGPACACHFLPFPSTGRSPTTRTSGWATSPHGGPPHGPRPTGCLRPGTPELTRWAPLPIPPPPPGPATAAPLCCSRSRRPVATAPCPGALGGRRPKPRR
ncbi:hypothetical protein [Streptomyces benahoarensis]|uniref:hypothetical protein n=1 Tax=Streptomyces benahoarensis TaxID=2595054 RepID=UPI003D802C50